MVLLFNVWVFATVSSPFTYGDASNIRIKVMYLLIVLSLSSSGAIRCEYVRGRDRALILT